MHEYAAVDSPFDLKTVLQELMNIAVGRAAAELEDIFGITMSLDVPAAYVAEIDGDRLPDTSDGEGTRTWIIEQEFHGPMRGVARLLGQVEQFQALCDRVGTADSRTLDRTSLQSLLQHASLEIGGVLTGACAASLSQLTVAGASFSVPRLRSSPCTTAEALAEVLCVEDSVTLLARIVVDESEARLQLPITLAGEAAQWLYERALHTLLEQ